MRSQTNAIGNLRWRYHSAQAIFAGAALLLSTAQVGGTPCHRHSFKTMYSYDADGNRTEVTDAKQHPTTWAFDARHRMTDKTWPTVNGIAAHESWTYDANNNVRTNTRPNGQVLTHRYDALNRHVEETITPAIAGQLQHTAWTHDGNGNPRTIEETLAGSSPRTETRHYDAFDRVDHVRDVEGRELSYAYDANGNRTHRVSTLGGTTIQTDWTYDPLNRNATMTTTGQGTTTLDYFPSGLLQKITRPTGATSETDYDGAGRIVRITHANAGVPIATIAYRYDLNGNRIEQKETNGAVTGGVEQTTTYDYDKADRLTATQESEAGGTRTTIYTLDPVGNRSHETIANAQGQTVSDSTLTCS